MRNSPGVARLGLLLSLPFLLLGGAVRAAEQTAAAPTATTASAREPLPDTVLPNEAFPGSSAAATPDLVRQPVAELYAALEDLMRRGQALSFQQRYQRLTPAIDGAFDLEAVLRASVGREWPAISPAARDRLAAAFRRFTITTYVVNFDRDSGQRFEILPEPLEAAGDQIVQTRLITSTDKLIRLDYIVRHTSAGWRIRDVLLDGTISRVAVQRSDFRALLHQDDADALTVSLRRKAADLSNGSLDP